LVGPWLDYPRIIAEGYPHHITQRGNRREDVFLTAAE
jgi:REP element-mobilizing transposase RayT